MTKEHWEEFAEFFPVPGDPVYIADNEWYLMHKIAAYDKYLSNFVKNLKSLSDDKNKVYRPSGRRGF